MDADDDDELACVKWDEGQGELFLDFLDKKIAYNLITGHILM